ncbi:hypothetical protein Ab1vBOLIVR2_gp38 [Agrobacterium phage OLIVR2]|uniref:Uncharacterized protein n=1 Tax=Agrobacterium phage OLIVR1 TaxID=2723769 RepID=A0A858MRQ2_9CAUD|nr:hypothetical protein KNU98_gp071 [Agrobacterium phage OLIVR1]QIW87233.1 hypothetical protein Ab1vBOLIVR1_gp38 [Agrobacterium phage OLIVR1]QIW87341.1 hypothetical protein Ab1vBOLIVR2_gp38 [Agrobacterium phage OLIVR2]QIW87448.1 hypothetical protein Ab1vBOLIVR3_gp38 [Agrobacterium phage OLIVR3]
MVQKPIRLLQPLLLNNNQIMNLESPAMCRAFFI